MPFICDDNLGKLTRYLRFLGFDTYFKEPIDDNELLRIAASQERILLSRDSRLTEKIHPFGFLLVTIDEPLMQLREVIASFDLQIDISELFLRCSVCNDLCVAIEKSQVRDEVFPYILNTQDLIRQCPSCHRYYWKGTHYQKIVAELKSAIPEERIIGSWPP
jgi:uncharacterized protein